MQTTPKGLRLHLGIYGRRNVGKSSLLNAITRQSVSVVSNVAGTTTDPVEKPMELLPIGPVVFIDTAGIDDKGALGELRIQQTQKAFERTDIALLVTDEGQWGEFEEGLVHEMTKRNVPTIAVFNKTDIKTPSVEIISHLENKKIQHLETIAEKGVGIEKLKDLIVQLLPEDFLTPPGILSDLVPAGDMAMFVVPIDMEAPKGRLILPQVQSIRDILDNDSYCMVVKERELKDALERLKRPPALVVTDSQAFLKVSADTPEEIPLTSFSILFARFKGDLEAFVRGALAIDTLKSGDRVLVAEACSHHPIGEDIGTVKIPRWLKQYVGGKLNIDHVQGRDFPSDVSDYQLVIHCGSCVWNRRQVLSRIIKCHEQGVPITNYGVAIAFTLGIIERAIEPFPALAEFVKLA